MSLTDFAAEADRCSQCSGCKWIPYDQMKSWQFAKNCPSVSYFNFNAYSARGRYALTRGLVQGEIEITDSIMRGVVSLPHGWGHDLDGSVLSVVAVSLKTTSIYITCPSGPTSIRLRSMSWRSLRSFWLAEPARAA